MKLIINNEFILCSEKMRDVLFPILQFQKFSGFGMSKTFDVVCMIRRSKEHDGMFRFPTGYLWKVAQYLKNKGIEYSIDSSQYKILRWKKPHLPGVTLRPDQERLIIKALKNGRGVIQSATATGKSFIIAGIMSAYPGEKILFLVHKTDLVYQIKEDLERFNLPQEIGVYSGTEKNIQPLTLATVQSFRKVAPQYANYFDVVIIDEVHRFANLDGMYAHTMRNLEAPVKLGTTATLPSTQEGRMVLEALVGPVLGSLSIQEAAGLKIIAKPVINIYDSGKVPYMELFDETTVPIPEKYALSKKRFDPRRYATVYQNGIVLNKTRNNIIVKLAKMRLEEEKSVLITIVNIDHGNELMKIIGNKFPCVFLSGKDTKSKRLKVKKDFENGIIKCVIASSIFTEGVNFPHLDVLIIAGGQKAEISTIQKVGRGLRKTKTKTEVEIIDFDDDGIHHFLANHSQERFRLYGQNNWV